MTDTASTDTAAGPAAPAPAPSAPASLGTVTKTERNEVEYEALLTQEQVQLALTRAIAAQEGVVLDPACTACTVEFTYSQVSETGALSIQSARVCIRVNKLATGA